LFTESYITPWEGGDQPTGIVVGLSGAVSTREYSVECFEGEWGIAEDVGGYGR